MSKPVAFTVGDVTRLLRALRKAGETPTSVEIDPTGRIVAKLSTTAAPTGDGNPWDDLLNGQEQRPAAERH